MIPPQILALAPRVAPFLITAAVGFSISWYIQGVRLASAKNELESYKIEYQRQIVLERKAASDQQTEAANAWAKNLEVIKADNEGLRRCIAAGKCRGLPVVPACSGGGLRAPGSVDGTRADAVPAAREPAPEVIGDCEKTVGMLNALQLDLMQYKKRTSQ